MPLFGSLRRRDELACGPNHASFVCMHLRAPVLHDKDYQMSSWALATSLPDYERLISWSAIWINHRFWTRVPSAATWAPAAALAS